MDWSRFIFAILICVAVANAQDQQSVSGERDRRGRQRGSRQSSIRRVTRLERPNIQRVPDISSQENNDRFTLTGTGMAISIRILKTKFIIL